MVGDFLSPKSPNETTIQILSGPKWDGERWVWAFFMFWWDNSPAICGRCGACTHNRPCGHPEAIATVRGQIFLTNLEETEKRVIECGHSIRWIRDGVVIGATEAKQHGAHS